MDKREAAFLLGVEEDADAAAVKSAYKRKAFESHPDRGGSSALFDLIGEAKEVLCGEEPRRRVPTPPPPAQTQTAPEPQPAWEESAYMAPEYEWQDDADVMPDMDDHIAAFTDAPAPRKPSRWVGVGQFSLSLLITGWSSILATVIVCLTLWRGAAAHPHAISISGFIARIVHAPDEVLGPTTSAVIVGIVILLVMVGGAAVVDVPWWSRPLAVAFITATWIGLFYAYWVALIPAAVLIAIAVMAGGKGDG